MKLLLSSLIPLLRAIVIKVYQMFFNSSLSLSLSVRSSEKRKNTLHFHPRGKFNKALVTGCRQHYICVFRMRQFFKDMKMVTVTICICELLHSKSIDDAKDEP